MIEVTAPGSFDRSQYFLKRLAERRYLDRLSKYGEQGVRALELNTPRDSGITAGSWKYEVLKTSAGYEIAWGNTNKNGQYNVAILVQYGHGTNGGSYISGQDYINPAMAPVFDDIIEDVWNEVRVQ